MARGDVVRNQPHRGYPLFVLVHTEWKQSSGRKCPIRLVTFVSGRMLRLLMRVLPLGLTAWSMSQRLFSHWSLNRHLLIHVPCS